MDRNSTIGFILIGVLFIVWWQVNKPSAEELEAQQRLQDSLAQVQQVEENSQLKQESETAQLGQNEIDESIDDTVSSEELKGQFGYFAPGANGEEQEFTLENDEIRILFSSKGGFIKEVWLKNYKVNHLDEENKEYQVDLKMLNDERTRFDYLLETVDGRLIRTGDLYFEKVSNTSNSLILRTLTTEGGYIEYNYGLSEDGYKLDYDLKLSGLGQILRAENNSLVLHWDNYLNKLEKNIEFERRYSTLYYKEAEDDPTYCSCQKSDLEDLSSTPVSWVSHSNQFFSTNLVAHNNFKGLIAETIMLDVSDPALKQTRSTLILPFNRSNEENFSMEFYLGPNDFELLEGVAEGMTEIIPYGLSVLGTFNRWVFRPVFNFIVSIFGSVGIAIIVITFFVKLVLYPLTYKMLHSQAKMASLKPEILRLKEKNKDDQQAQQMETMKLYREFGVNPFGGCMPMVIQMPIWFALYRFFPADIIFRQTPFLWSNDLSSYDAIAFLPFNIPMYGTHISLFTLLWGVSLLAYTIYNARNLDMTAANPMMKYMQYFMPVMFLIFLNQYASGLTCYLLFSNIFNIAQTVITKQFVFNDERIKAELMKNKEKPKKKSGFQARLQKAMEEQQKSVAAKQKGKKN